MQIVARMQQIQVLVCETFWIFFFWSEVGWICHTEPVDKVSWLYKAITQIVFN